MECQYFNTNRQSCVFVVKMITENNVIIIMKNIITPTFPEALLAAFISYFKTTGVILPPLQLKLK